MIDLVIDPRDPSLDPAGPAVDGSSYRSVKVTVSPSRVVRLAAGGFLWEGLPKVVSMTSPDPITVSVPATDGTEIHVDDRSTFTYTVKVESDPPGHGQGRGPRTVSFTGMLPTSLGATVQVTALSAAEPLPAPYITVAEVLGEIDTQISTPGTAAHDAIIATVGTVSDPATATLVTSASSTRTALDGRYPLKPRTSRVRYVDATTGSDSNTGASPGSSFATIQAAIDALGTDGGKVLVHDGIYAPFAVTKSGLEIESLGGRRKTIIRNLSSTGDGVSVTGTSALVTLVQTAIRGFTIAGPGKGVGSGRGVAVKWVSVDFCLEDCWITSWGSDGFYAEDSYSATVRQTLIDNCGGDGFRGVTNINNWTFDRTISILNGGNGYAITGGTSCLFLNADAESNVKAGFDLRYVFAPTLLACHMEKNGSDGTSPNVYLHYRSSLSEKTTAANVLGCIIQGSAVTKRGLVIDGASRTTYQGNWFAGHVTEHVQTTSNADRTWVGPNTYSAGIPEFTDGSASSVRMDYDVTNLCARTDVLRYVPRSLNPAVLAQGQQWWSSTTDQLKARGATDIRTVFAGYQGTATLDFPSIAAGATAELTVTVTGAVSGDSVTLGPPATIAAGLMWAGYVSAANTVTVRLHNTTGSAIDPVSAGWKVNVIRS